MKPYLITAHTPHPGADPDGPGGIPSESELSPVVCREVCRLVQGARLAEGATSGDRRAFVAAQSGERLAIEVHANMGRGRAGIVFYMPGSKRGERAARLIAAELQREIRIIAPDYYCIVQPAQDKWDDGSEAWPNTQDALHWTWPDDPKKFKKMVECSGVLVELGFLDQPKHAALWKEDGLKICARGIASGLWMMS
ncbi:MAG: hypothetical protein WC911_02015 [Thermoleophilia bacterium]